MYKSVCIIKIDSNFLWIETMNSASTPISVCNLHSPAPTITFYFILVTECMQFAHRDLYLQLYYFNWFSFCLHLLVSHMAITYYVCTPEKSVKWVFLEMVSKISWSTFGLHRTCVCILINIISVVIWFSNTCFYSKKNPVTFALMINRDVGAWFENTKKLQIVTISTISTGVVYKDDKIIFLFEDFSSHRYFISFKISKLYTASEQASSLGVPGDIFCVYLTRTAICNLKISLETVSLRNYDQMNAS